MNFWNPIVIALTHWLSRFFGTDFMNWFSKQFDDAKDHVPAPIVSLGAAPEEVKDLVRNSIIALVEKALANRPFIKGLVLGIVRNLPDSFIDGLWDSIFAEKIKAGELPAASTFPVTTAAAEPVMLSASDIATAKAEAGIAAGSSGGSGAAVAGIAIVVLLAMSSTASAACGGRSGIFSRFAEARAARLEARAERAASRVVAPQFAAATVTTSSFSTRSTTTTVVPPTFVPRVQVVPVPAPAATPTAPKSVPVPKAPTMPPPVVSAAPQATYYYSTTTTASGSGCPGGVCPTSKRTGFFGRWK